jgi:LacI family gluconate utilization system Gnt-I transcriptional repressor
MEKTRKVTLADVAAIANVSPITVSRALRDPEKVSPDARSRIAFAISRLGYVPDPAARALASGRTDIVGVIIPSVSNNVFADVMRGIYDGLQDGPLGVQLGTTRYSPSTEEQLIRVFLSQRPAGLIVAGHDQSASARTLLENAECPIVQIMEVGPPPVDLAIGLSHYRAAYAGAQHLLDMGYRAPAFLGAQMDPRSQRRLAGFRDCLVAAGMGADDPVVTTPEPSSVTLGCQLFADLMAARPETDAVLCNNDDLALGVLFEAQRRNIRVPDRIGICGFNDHEMMSAAEPPLTSVATDRFEMGRAAIQQIRDRLAGKGHPRGHAVDLGFQMMPRASTAHVRA